MANSVAKDPTSKGGTLGGAVYIGQASRTLIINSQFKSNSADGRYYSTGESNSQKILATKEVVIIILWRLIFHPL